MPGIGIILELTCPHQSENHWNKTISFKKRGKRISGNKAIQLIVSDLNSNRGTREPLIEIPTPFNTIRKTGNRFDDSTVNNYFFNAVKTKTAIDYIKDVESQPVEGGGSFEKMYVRFKSKYNHSTHTDLDIVELQAFEQGYQDDSTGNFTNIPNLTLKKPSLSSGERPNILSMDSNEDPEEATNVTVIGDKNSGSYPRELMLYQGAKEVFLSAKEWSDTTHYKQGRLVTNNSITYECIKNHTNKQTTNDSFWIVRTFTKPDTWNPSITYPQNKLVKYNDIAYKNITPIRTIPNQPPSLDKSHWVRIFFAPTVDYSPLTKDKIQYWVNALAGAKHAATDNGRTQIIDPNCIIHDKYHPRTHVDFVGTNPDDIPDSLLVDGNVPDAFRVLVIDPTYLNLGGRGDIVGTGKFARNDLVGIPFAGNIAEFVDYNNDGIGFWRVFKSKILQQDQEVFDWHEGLPWVKYPSVPANTIDRYVNEHGESLFLNQSPAPRSATWNIGSYALSEIPFVGKVGAFITGKQFSCAHSVKWDNINNRVDMGNEKILNEMLEPESSAVFIKSIGSSIGISNQNNPLFIGFNIHSRWPRTGNAIPFGNVSAGEKIKNPTTDLNNMDLTHTLKSEWFGPGVEDYYPFQSFEAWLRLQISDGLLPLLEDFDGDYTIGIWLADRNDNQMVLEFKQDKNFKTLFMSGILSKLKQYKGVPGVSVFFRAEEPDSTVAFDPSEFLVGGIYTKDSFDDQGRYKGIINSRFKTKPQMKMSLDMFRITKPLVATSIDESNIKPDTNIESLKVQRPHITGYSQAKNLSLGIAELLNFDRREFNLEVTNGRDVSFGDSVYVTDTKAIDDSDDNIPHTLKLVAKSVTLSLSKTKNGPGGLKKYVKLTRRFWP